MTRQYSPRPVMSDLDAIMVLEGDDADDQDRFDAMQALIDSGTVWKLQGSYQRAAAFMIDAGHCIPKES
jgi:hypothetical protein